MLYIEKDNTIFWNSFYHKLWDSIIYIQQTNINLSENEIQSMTKMI